MHKNVVAEKEQMMPARYRMYDLSACVAHVDRLLAESGARF
jgi:hypothetical protein